MHFQNRLQSTIFQRWPNTHIRHPFQHLIKDLSSHGINATERRCVAMELNIGRRHAQRSADLPPINDATGNRIRAPQEGLRFVEVTHFQTGSDTRAAHSLGTLSNGVEVLDRKPVKFPRLTKRIDSAGAVGTKPKIIAHINRSGRQGFNQKLDERLPRH